MAIKRKPGARPAAASRAVSRPHKRINLALQGGGAHGAFTWGVLDRFLADDRIEIEGICGTSAGAMNAAVAAYGHARDGRDGARVALAAFWKKVAEAGAWGPIQRTPLDRMMGSFSLDRSPTYFWFDIMSRIWSPYQTNPLNFNPLRDILADCIDFDVLRTQSTIKLFVCATNVESGKVRVFQNNEMKVESLLASACLPFMFQTVEVDGQHYWDGGYMGNPAIFPLIYACESRDVVLVQINPLERRGVPRSAREILDRVNEISFNSTLMREMRAVHFVSRLIESGQLSSTDYKHMLIHMVEADDVLKELGASTKLVADLAFLEHLKGIGHAAADAWLEQHFDALGTRSTLDLVATYL
ncbi:patatin-like phospholipase family protein [Zavarzinia sp. CC-PAN008]|uniref:patatin-like phospholipase family protein n=1 Tax=Zavarzinia sp. CC-PAN008 TaxID=3243332 RepID=UPI003F748AEC